jgi:hypothetical protein
VLCLGLSAWALVRRRWDIGLWALAANALLFVILLPAPPYEDIYASSRVTTGVVMGFVIAIPALTQLRPSFRWVGAVIVLAWMAPWWVLYDASWFPHGRQPGGARTTQYLGVSIQGSSTTALPGQEVDFTIWSTNADPVHGYGDVVLRIELPPGLKLVGPPYHERGPGCTGATTITCPLVSLSPQMGTPIRFGVRLANGAPKQTLTTLLSAQGATPQQASFTIVPQ